MNANILISLTDLIVSLAFAFFVLRQYAERKKMHQLMWGIALVVWVIAVGAEFAATVDQWTPLIYRLYYATGALLIPAWLGMGTLYLVAPRRWADRILVILGIASTLGIVLIAIWQIDPAVLRSSPEQFVPLRIFPFFPIQVVLIALNIFGTIAFVGGALWSAVHFARSRTLGERMIATILIAIGGSVAAIAHSLGAIGGIEMFRVSELIAVVLIFAGFMLTLPIRKTSAQTAMGKS